MTRLNGELSYTVFTRPDQYRTLYRLMAEQDLLWAAWPDVDEWTEDEFVARLMRPEVYTLGGCVHGNPAGCLTLRPFGESTLAAEIGVTALRPYFDRAVELLKGALVHVLETFEPGPSVFVGRVALCHGHIFRLLAALGFSEAARLPKLMWHCRKKKFVDGALVIARPEDILEG